MTVIFRDEFDGAAGGNSAGRAANVGGTWWSEGDDGVYPLRINGAGGAVAPSASPNYARGTAAVVITGASTVAIETSVDLTGGLAAASTEQYLAGCRLASAADDSGDEFVGISVYANVNVGGLPNVDFGTMAGNVMTPFPQAIALPWAVRLEIARGTGGVTASVNGIVVGTSTQTLGNNLFGRFEVYAPFPVLGYAQIEAIGTAPDPDPKPIPGLILGVLHIHDEFVGIAGDGLNARLPEVRDRAPYAEWMVAGEESYTAGGVRYLLQFHLTGSGEAQFFGGAA